MPRPLVVLNVVGLSFDMLGTDTPHLSRLASEGFARPMGTVMPAVTCSAQATLLTGLTPREHGVVANGWYWRDLSEVMFWRQSNRLVKGERVYDAARKRDPSYSVAKLFWWFNMYADVNWSVTPRPAYPADGRKVFDSYSQPAELKDELQNQLGVFPLMKFWGPGADIESSRWIADASIEVMRRHDPSLTLVYLPHLDYNLQRLGPSDPRVRADIRAIDEKPAKSSTPRDSAMPMLSHSRNTPLPTSIAPCLSIASCESTATCPLAEKSPVGKRSTAEPPAPSLLPIINWRTSMCDVPKMLAQSRNCSARSRASSLSSIARRKLSSGSIMSEPENWSS